MEKSNGIVCCVSCITISPRNAHTKSKSTALVDSKGETSMTLEALIDLADENRPDFIITENLPIFVKGDLAETKTVADFPQR